MTSESCPLTSASMLPLTPSPLPPIHTRTHAHTLSHTQIIHTAQIINKREKNILGRCVKNRIDAKLKKRPEELIIVE